MTFHTDPDAPGRSAIELRDDDGRIVATIYAQRAGLHISCGHGYTPQALPIEHRPAGLQVELRREDGGAGAQAAAPRPAAPDPAERAALRER